MMRRLRHRPVVRHRPDDSNNKIFLFWALSTARSLLSLPVWLRDVAHRLETQVITGNGTHMKKLLAVLVTGLCTAGAFAQAQPTPAPAVAQPTAAAPSTPVVKAKETKSTKATTKSSKKKTSKKAAKKTA
jgi:hypothetical protein